MTLNRDIEAAWAKLSLPFKDSVTEHRCSECDEIAARFAGTHWSAQTTRKIESGEVALMTPRAFRHFLPSFMLFALERPDEIGLLADELFWALEYPRHSPHRDRLDELSPAQLDVVRRFFEWLGRQGHLDEQDASDLSGRLSGLGRAILSSPPNNQLQQSGAGAPAAE